ncbi:hypothetical protein AUP68_16024 [Ilyonectria robusta]
MSEYYSVTATLQLPMSIPVNPHVNHIPLRSLRLKRSARIKLGPSPGQRSPRNAVPAPGRFPPQSPAPLLAVIASLRPRLLQPCARIPGAYRVFNFAPLGPWPWRAVTLLHELIPVPGTTPADRMTPLGGCGGRAEGLRVKPICDGDIMSSFAV